MILYFADRNLNILGQASTHLPKGVKVVEDLTTEDLETGVSIFECDIPFDRSTRAKVQEWTELGNYILKSSDGENKLYSIIDAEIDTKKQRVTIYAEDDGLDLLNEVVGEYEADQYYPIAYYVEKYAAGSGWEIGINEVEGLTRKLNLDSEETTHARLLKIAAAFNNCNLSFSFDIDGLQVKKKYINIYAERGKDTGEQLRLNKEIDGIITTKSIANLATALQVTGGTPDNAETPITLSGYAYDDGDFYIEGSILKSRKALEKWQRFLWKNDETQQAGGHIVKQYSSDTLSQEELCLNAIEELKLVCDMEINFEVDATEFPENARIGDRVNIIDDEGELYLSSRILILETSEANGTRTAVLGEHLIRKSGISAKVEKLAAQFAKTSVTAARANMLANNANEIAEDAKTQAENALTEANAVVGIAENAKTTAEAAQEAALNAKAEAEAAEAAANAVVEKVEGFETAINNAQAAADNAYTAAETATAKAEEAETAANNALTELETSKEAMQAAQNTAENAISKAETAENTAATAKSEAEAASTTARAAKLDAEQAQKEIDNLSLELTTVEQTMTAEYARKTDLTEATADLQTQISQNAAEISSTASKVTFIDETANNAAAQAQAAFYTAEQAQQEADEATALATQAQAEADTAQQAADNAQAEADTARQAAETAQSVADQAEADLIQAQKDLDEIRASATATEEEIAAAELAVQNAQTTATNAQAEAAEAVTVANNAQAEADTAVTNAVNAQNYADYAAKQAEIAQLAAEKVSESAAAQAMQKANDAQSTADTAQNTANTAKANADNAQSIANTAAATAANAQAIADEAKSDMQKAEADLQEAKQTLADVTSRVDATEEEVQAAQAAVATAQSKADEAKANAQAAQATADTAKANAATAQTAANNAKTAADNAQTAADEAQAAADKALEDVGKLETRLTTAETKITQNSEQIKLMATKTEVTTALNGYYTKSETDAAISVKADEINLGVASKYTTKEDFNGLEIGGRNLVLQSKNLVALNTVGETNKLVGAYASGYIVENYADGMNAVRIGQWQGLGFYADAQELKSGEKYTFSATFDNTSDTNAAIWLYLMQNNSEGNRIYTIANHCWGVATVAAGSKKRVSTTLTIEDDWFDVIENGVLRVTFQNATALNSGYVYAYAPKLEKGIKSTDWTPAPEDMATAEDITETKASIQVLDNKITSNVSETNSLKTRMSTVEQTASGLSSRVTSVENMEIGGRNLMPNSEWIASTALTSNAWSTNAQKVYVTYGETYTLSLYYNGVRQTGTTYGIAYAYAYKSDGTIAYYASNGTSPGDYFHTHGNGRVTVTIDDENIAYLSIRIGPTNCAAGDVYRVKFEKGNKATDWTPAPEDVEADITTAVNNIQVGGRNFVRNGDFSKGRNYWSDWGSPATREVIQAYNKQWAHIVGTGTAFYQGYIQYDPFYLESGKRYILSATVYGGAENQVFTIGIHYKDSSGTIKTQQWQNWTVGTAPQKITLWLCDIEANFKTINLMIGVSSASTVYDVYFTDVKLEKGNKATDYTPAPEDIEADIATVQTGVDNNAQSISEAETNIEQLSDQISTLVQDGSGKSLMTQTSSGWVFSMGDFEEALNNLLAHIKIGTYNGSPCLELTVDDTKQKLMLTNTEIRFMESDTTAAYITGDVMNIDNAQVENKLSVAGYELSVDSDGTLNLVYQ